MAHDEQKSIFEQSIDGGGSMSNFLKHKKSIPYMQNNITKYALQLHIYDGIVSQVQMKNMLLFFCFFVVVLRNFGVRFC